MSNDQQLVIIPNAIKPYGYEMVNVLAYPNGFVQRFRFTDEWVDPVVAKGETTQFLGRSGYIVLRDKETGRLYPIRQFKLLSLSRVGVIHHFQIEVGELFEFDSSAGTREDQIRIFNEKLVSLKQELRASNIAGSDMSPLVFTTGYFPDHLKNCSSTASTAADKEAERWGNVLECLRSVAFFDQVEFLRIVKVAELGAPEKLASLKNHAFEVVRGRSYEVTVAQQRFGALSEGGPPRKIELLGDGRAVIPVRANEVAVGKYDVLSFVMRLDKREGVSSNFFDLRFTPPEKFASYINPLIHVPITLHRSALDIVPRIALTLVFGAIYFVPAVVSWLAEVLPKHVLGLESHIFVHDCALVGLTVVLVDLLAELRRQ